MHTADRFAFTPRNLFSSARLSSRLRRTVLSVAVVCALALGALPGTFAQDKFDYDAERKRAFDLLEQKKLGESLPILEKLYAANPSDVEVMARLMIGSFYFSAGVKDPEARKQARLRARGLAEKMKEMGGKNNTIDFILDSIPPDGGDDGKFSTNKAVEEAMRDGEAAFASGDAKKALAAYAKALELNPKQYEAALFSGDVYFKDGKMDKAGEWFAKAVEIDPDRETAYRYWGDALLEKDKREEARAKFIEAVVAEPYSRLPWSGLIKWGQKYKVQLSHPRVETASSVSADKDKTTLTLDINMLGKNDGSDAWLGYGITRALWINEKFAKEYPNEKKYRHSLREEVEALKTVADLASASLKDGKLKEKSLDVSLANLLKLNKAGLLEAFVLLAKPDAGVVRDYEAYRRDHRDKLRQYLVEFVTAGSK
ncbi:MAG TPA: tetratricopeptide repeat protein [Blastocatellia bacterium]|nr:tetratricopeptide repeat protein [Blastocatellia bacterium]